MMQFLNDQLINNAQALFDNEEGKGIRRNIEKAIKDHSMKEHILNGVAVGLSGGPDSVMLLLYLWKLRQKENFKLCAIHVNHMIRGTDADRDEEFSKELCKLLSIDFHSSRVDVPALAKERKVGTEEAAREARYSVFDKVLSESQEIQTIATAHNSTDNAETVMFNLSRGTGLRGLAGISPVRGNIIRPLIYLQKESILRLLDLNNIPYVIDETNNSTEYSRNCIRHKILPKFKALNSAFEHSVLRTSMIVREESDYLDSLATEFLRLHNNRGMIDYSCLSGQHPVLIKRIIKMFCNSYSNRTVEYVHIKKIHDLLSLGGDFSYDYPGERTFVFKNGICSIRQKAAVNNDTEKSKINQPLKLGLNEIKDLGIGIYIGADDNTDFSSNVYKFSIQEKIDSDIIVGSLYVRCRKDGDAYRFGGMTRKLKKLFCDKKIPLTVRNKVPVICDDNGILWVPPFPPKDGSRVKGVASRTTLIKIYEYLL